MIDEKKLSSYLDDLPAIYREEATEGRPDFLGRFLLAFEHVLTGVGDRDQPGLEEILEGISDNSDERMAGAHRYFTPGPGKDDFERAPETFLEWMSGWVALTLRDDWDENERRRMLAEIVPSYSKRGTPDGLKQVLAAFAGVSPQAVTISERYGPFQLAVTSTLGKDMKLGSAPPHFFKVRVLVPGARDLRRRRAVVRAIVDMEKPAHTYYNERDPKLIQAASVFRIGVTSTIGVDTVFGASVLNT